MTNDWQPIETAPKGVPILAVDADGTMAVVVGAFGRGGRISWFDPLYDMAGLDNPTHWQPLPEPPQ